MSQYPDAQFILSADRPEQFVADEGREVAVAGRSNAGKSSAINALVKRRGFARTSKTPGRTQLINFFGLARQARLVDLPGYGYARVPEATRQRWGALLEHYFENRRSLCGLLLVVDARRGVGDFDRRMLAFAQSVGVPVHVLLTKADKLNRGPARAALLKAQQELGDTATAQLFSATAGTGLDEARAMLGNFLGPAGPL